MSAPPADPDSMKRCTGCDRVLPRSFFYQRKTGCYIALLREKRLWRVYGITSEDFDSLLAEQGGVCAICGSPNNEGKSHLVVDHEHELGHIRGLLCTRCNTGLGSFKDDPDRLRQAILYLERHGEQRHKIEAERRRMLTDPNYGKVS